MLTRSRRTYGKQQSPRDCWLGVSMSLLSLITTIDFRRHLCNQIKCTYSYWLPSSHRGVADEWRLWKLRSQLRRKAGVHKWDLSAIDLHAWSVWNELGILLLPPPLPLHDVHIHDYELYLPFTLYAEKLRLMTHGLDFARHQLLFPLFAHIHRHATV